MSTFQLLYHTLEEIFSATAQTEEELDYASATLILAGLLQIYARTPRYASHRSRLESFPPTVPAAASVRQSSSAVNRTHISSSPTPSSYELASAGFFHTGSGDETVCPACGLGLRDWQATDQPEACHLAYSTAEVGMSSTGGGSNHSPTPALPCLYLAVHRLLVSELPLARKSLVPAGPVQSVCKLPGVITPPSIVIDGLQKPAVGFASLADRLHTIARIMSSPPSPQGWPIENARALGHSDDLILLALWRLQAESTAMGLICPSTDDLRLDPQDTADVLRSILRVQEGFDAVVRDVPTFDSGSLGDEDESSGAMSEGSDSELTAEDAETAALSQCRSQRIRAAIVQVSNVSTSAHSVDSNGAPVKRIRLPRLYQFLSWWANRWPVEQVVHK